MTPEPHRPGPLNSLRRKLQGMVRHFPWQPRRAPPQPARLGLALGGGFARGLAHIGVMKVLEESRLPVGVLGGTSVGSIIAGAYASGATIGEMAMVAKRIRWRDFGQWTLSRMGLASNQRLETLVGRFFRATQFEDLKIPLVIVATDLCQGRTIRFTSGELSFAVRASCAYPGMFLPIPHNDCWLVDGGMTCGVPTEEVRRLGAEVVVAVALDNIGPAFEPKNLLDVLARSFSIAQRTADPLWRRHADLVVEPQVSHYRWDEFSRADEIIEAGAAAMRAALPRLKECLTSPPVRRRPAW